MNKHFLVNVDGTVESASKISRFGSLGELAAEIYESICYYNYKRIYTSLGMPPKKFAEKFAQEKEIKYTEEQEKLTV